MPQIYIEEVIVIAVQFEKTGVVNASGEGVNPNLVLNSVAATGSHLESGNEYMAFNLGQSYMDITSGTTVTISFDLEIKYVTESSYFLIYNTNNKGPKQISGTNIGAQIFSGHSVGETIKKRVSATTTIIDRSTTPTITDNYIEFYSTYHTGNVFKISNLKIELGSVPTPWCPNEADAEYVGTTIGFAEANGNPSIGKAGYVQATEFIEW